MGEFGQRDTTSNLHLLDPADRLRVDPTLSASIQALNPIRPLTLTEMTENVLNSPKPPGADVAAHPHLYEDAKPPGLQLPKPPFGLKGDKGGVGFDAGGQQFRLLPHLFPPKALDPNEKRKEFMDRADELHREQPREGEKKK